MNSWDYPPMNELEWQHIAGDIEGEKMEEQKMELLDVVDYVIKFIENLDEFDDKKLDDTVNELFNIAYDVKTTIK